RDESADPRLRNAVFEAEMLVAGQVGPSVPLLFPDHLGLLPLQVRWRGHAPDGRSQMAKFVAGDNDEDVWHLARAAYLPALRVALGLWIGGITEKIEAAEQIRTERRPLVGDGRDLLVGREFAEAGSREGDIDPGSDKPLRVGAASAAQLAKQVVESEHLT